MITKPFIFQFYNLIYLWNVTLCNQMWQKHSCTDNQPYVHFCIFTLFIIWHTTVLRYKEYLVSAHDWSPNTHGYRSSCTFFLAAWGLNKIIGYAQFQMHEILSFKIFFIYLKYEKSYTLFNLRYTIFNAYFEPKNISIFIV